MVLNNEYYAVFVFQAHCKAIISCFTTANFNEK